MSAAVYARCTEPTGSNARDGCGWTGEVERVTETCPMCHGDGKPCSWCDVTGKVYDIDKCPSCGGTIEVDK